MRLIIQIFYLVMLMITVNPVSAGTIDVSEQLPFEQCGYCHEFDGNSIMPDYPRLAGQQDSYLVKQLQDFKMGKRKGLMQATAELLSAEDIKAVAKYFSQQTAKSNIPAARQKTDHEAKKLYLQGDTARSLMACSTCHGRSGLGGSDTPRLSTQHENYLVKQLVLFKKGQRSNDKDRVMRDIAAKLTQTEIVKMAKFLSRMPSTQSSVTTLSEKYKSEIKQ